MRFRKIIYYSLGIITVLALVLFVVISNNKKESLQVVFFDVGQGDSILISSGSQQLLIDGGKGGKLLLEKLGKYVPFWDREIEMVIETHPDADHIGGLIDVFKTYKVDNVMKTNLQSDSQTFRELERLIGDEKVQVVQAQRGQRINFSNGASAEVIFPFDSVLDISNKDTNASSVTIKLNFGENKFLFTGDLPIEKEKEILEKGINVKADVLKVGHHGSKYSSSNEFLDAVGVSDAVISVAKNNSYGHPSQDALQRLSAHGIKIFRTDELGDIVYECKNQNVKCQFEAK